MNNVELHREHFLAEKLNLEHTCHVRLTNHEVKLHNYCLIAIQVSLFVVLLTAISLIILSKNNIISTFAFIMISIFDLLLEIIFLKKAFKLDDYSLHCKPIHHSFF